MRPCCHRPGSWIPVVVKADGLPPSRRRDRHIRGALPPWTGMCAPILAARPVVLEECLSGRVLFRPVRRPLVGRVVGRTKTDFDGDVVRTPASWRLRASPLLTRASTAGASAVVAPVIDGMALRVRRCGSFTSMCDAECPRHGSTCGSGIPERRFPANAGRQPRGVVDWWRGSLRPGAGPRLAQSAWG